MASLRFVIFLLLSAVSVAGQSAKCNVALTAALATATDKPTRCDAVLAFDECLSLADDVTDTDLVIAKNFRESNGCKVVKMSPRLSTRDADINLEVDSDGDVVVHRLARQKISLLEMSQQIEDLGNKVDKQAISMDSALKTAYNMSAIALSNTVNHALQQLTLATDKIDSYDSLITTKVQSVNTTLNLELKELQNFVGEQLAESKKDSDKALDEIEKLSDQLKGDLTKLSAKVDTVEGRMSCNLNGKLKADGKTCECDSGYQGSTCSEKIFKNCAEVPEMGAYTLVENGKTRKTFCGPTTQGSGGWELAFNLETSQKPTAEYSSAFWTEVGKTLNEDKIENALIMDFKSNLFNTHKTFKEIMIYAHADGDRIGYSIYDVLAAKRGKSLSELFRSSGNQIITSSRKASSGSVQSLLFKNPNRNQRLFGDVFIDYDHPVMFNKQSGWGACRNLNRMATTYSNGQYAHTFAGIGGWHEHGCGSYRTKYEAAPISPYCSMTNGYGSRNVVTDGVAYNGGCIGFAEGVSFHWINVDFAVFVR
eukprot:m.202544 g.202544  ORF g.202544 m.202544 type:complete len:537 (-) comp15751_c0_seq8:4566-6176(-)